MEQERACGFYFLSRILSFCESLVRSNVEKLFCVQCVSGDVAVALLLRSVCCLLMVLVVCAWGSGWEGTDIHKHRSIYMEGGGGSLGVK